MLSWERRAVLGRLIQYKPHKSKKMTATITADMERLINTMFRTVLLGYMFSVVVMLENRLTGFSH